MFLIIGILFGVLAITGIAALIFMLWDTGSWLRQRISGKPREEVLPEQIAAMEDHKSAADGSFDFD